MAQNGNMQKKKKDNTVFYLGLGGVFYIVFILVVCNISVCATRNPDMLGMDIFTMGLTKFVTTPFNIFPLNLKHLVIGTLIFGFFALWAYIEISNTNKLRPGVENGSAAWNEDMDTYNKTYTQPHKSKKVNETELGWIDSDGKEVDLKEYNKNYPEMIKKRKEEAKKKGEKFIYKPDIKPLNQNTILSDDIFLSMDGKATRRNCNMVVVGGSGSGKSRFVVKPNVLQENCSYVITDPGGFLMGEIGNFFLEKGYDIKLFNLTEMQYSNKYNPFKYIRNEEGVMTMINSIIRNTTPKGASQGDPFWEKSETALLMALSFYLYYECQPEDRNFSNILKLIRNMEVKEENEDYESAVDILFKTLAEKNPEHIAVRNYAVFKQAAGKTAKSIMISASARLNVFNITAIENLTNTDNIDLTSIGDKPTVLFCIIPIVDKTFNFLVALMYTQLFDSLYFHAASECKNHRLPIPVRFMLDEFANVGEIPEFEQKVATMRNFDISVTIILQNMAQLKAMYKDSWESLTGNCDTFIFLGGQEQTTLEYVSKKLGKETIKAKNTSRSFGSRGSSSQSFNTMGRELMTPDEIARMDNGYCIVFLRGELPFYTKKYDYPRHLNYKYTEDCNGDLHYDFKDYFDTSKEDADDEETKKLKIIAEIRANLMNKAPKIKNEELVLAKKQFREKSSAGVKTMKIHKDSSTVLREVGIAENEIAQVDIDLEDEYNPNSEYEIDS